MAKISVIVPIYGVEQYLEECLNSILKQTLTDLEIILINDGSKDRCPQIISEYAKKDNRIIAIDKENGGYGSAMNVGLSRATGEYIGIVEPDDYIDSKMYEDLYKIAKEFDSDIVKSSFYDNLQTKKEHKIKKVRWDDDKIPQNKSFTAQECGLFLYYHPSIWSCIYKREFLTKNDIKFVEAPGSGWTDNPFQVQTICLAERINYTPNAYYYWRRVNKYESNDLKDYTFPFKRSDEIHHWLEEQNITDKNILKPLCRRELAYINITLNSKYTNKKDCYEQIKKMCKRMNSSIIYKSKDIPLKEKMFLYLYLHNLFIGEILLKIITIRKNSFSIRLNKHEISIKLFGLYLVRKESEEV